MCKTIECRKHWLEMPTNKPFLKGNVKLITFAHVTWVPPKEKQNF